MNNETEDTESDKICRDELRRQKHQPANAQTGKAFFFFLFLYFHKSHVHLTEAEFFGGSTLDVNFPFRMKKLSWR